MSSEQNFQKSKVAKVAKKGFFRMVFSRAGIMLLLILIQLWNLYDDSVLSESLCNFTYSGAFRAVESSGT